MLRKRERQEEKREGAEEEGGRGGGVREMEVWCSGEKEKEESYQ